jgi:hypothetical protein
MPSASALTATKREIVVLVFMMAISFSGMLKRKVVLSTPPVCPPSM